MKAKEIDQHEDIAASIARLRRIDETNEWTRRQILAEYTALGLDPVYGLGGVISVSLARSLGKLPARMPGWRAEVAAEAYGDNLVDGERD